MQMCLSIKVLLPSLKKLSNTILCIFLDYARKYFFLYFFKLAVQAGKKCINVHSNDSSPASSVKPIPIILSLPDSMVAFVQRLSKRDKHVTIINVTRIQGFETKEININRTFINRHGSKKIMIPYVLSIGTRYGRSRSGS